MRRDLVGHPLLKAGVTHAHLLVCVAGCIPAVVAAGATDQRAALAAVMFAFEYRKLSLAHLAIVARLVWLPMLMHINGSGASFCVFVSKQIMTR
jgi:hypothetical protein